MRAPLSALLISLVLIDFSISSCARPNWVGITGISHFNGELTIHVNTCGHQVQRIEIRGRESGQTHLPIAVYESPEVASGNFSVNIGRPSPWKSTPAGFSISDADQLYIFTPITNTRDGSGVLRPEVVHRSVNAEWTDVQSMPAGMIAINPNNSSTELFPVSSDEFSKFCES